MFETDRTDILISALRDYLRDAAHSDEVKQEIAEAFYDNDITFEELKDLVGHEEAANFQLLKPSSSDILSPETAGRRELRILGAPPRIPQSINQIIYVI